MEQGIKIQAAGQSRLKIGIFVEPENIFDFLIEISKPDFKKIKNPLSGIFHLVPGPRIELGTPAFSGQRSTSELARHKIYCSKIWQFGKIWFS